MKLERNPADTEKYLACLNTCFPGWGGHDTFDWVFRRKVGPHASDLMILEADGEWIAGSAVSYRPLLLANGALVTAGIMTGSWTLPAARGRGCFTRIIDESVALVREKEGALLLAFVTVQNASYRRLAAAGAALFPTRYLFSNADTPHVTPANPTEDVAPTPALLAELEERARHLASGSVHVHYEGNAWANQIVHRAEPTTIVHVPGLGHAVVEPHGDFDRLQAVLPIEPSKRIDLVQALLGRAQARGHKLFLFVSDAVQGDAIAMHCGLGSTEGFLTVNIAACDVLENALGVEVRHPSKGEAVDGGGDGGARAAEGVADGEAGAGPSSIPAECDSRILGAPESEAFLGHFALQTGDRM